mmetsp:Transcript_9917/g.20839  ORF Transcript_9917/g.20839 Transcript_9917/m.20839 type:complete len:451 (+) Transcript_9917:250-1602(+)|eukprot:CAMPEP_0185855250 /NCGR_PEP_ID=MMETSP1354-20130828/25091_1 /TAXON_ID=708628 /ORGANISM="Erythrolobus madagascarensis, Strain CCMP3276" /LENGTH=450 /DNA_ID=CAMNT_0028557225 /DNA_START=165 /DNA_END=1517 /DNA_ORIENTATION=+
MSSRDEQDEPRIHVRKQQESVRSPQRLSHVSPTQLPSESPQLHSQHAAAQTPATIRATPQEPTFKALEPAIPQLVVPRIGPTPSAQQRSVLIAKQDRGIDGLHHTGPPQSERQSLEFILHTKRQAGADTTTGSAAIQSHPQVQQAPIGMSGVTPTHEGLRTQLQLRQINEYLAANERKDGRGGLHGRDQLYKRETMGDYEGSHRTLTAQSGGETTTGNWVSEAENPRNWRAALVASSNEAREDGTLKSTPQGAFRDSKRTDGVTSSLAGGSSHDGGELLQSEDEEKSPKSGAGKKRKSFRKEDEQDGHNADSHKRTDKDASSRGDQGEQDSTRKLRRKELNRESAQRSRNKKKTRGLLMEQLIFSLASEMHELRTAIAAISSVVEKRAAGPEQALIRLRDIELQLRTAEAIQSFAQRIVSVGGNQIEAQDILLHCVRLFSAPYSSSAPSQ